MRDGRSPQFPPWLARSSFFLLRRGVVLTLLSAGAAGVAIALTVGSALH